MIREGGHQFSIATLTQSRFFRRSGYRAKTLRS
jgi:hypothetical protein